MKTYIVNFENEREYFDGIPDGAYASAGTNSSSSAGDLFKMTYPGMLTPVLDASTDMNLNVGADKAGLEFEKKTGQWVKS
ncbi:MAG: hypothetical protein ABJH04_08095 [Cyclobacteriaceae bacterium]